MKHWLPIFALEACAPDSVQMACSLMAAALCIERTARPSCFRSTQLSFDPPPMDTLSRGHTAVDLPSRLAYPGACLHSMCQIGLIILSAWSFSSDSIIDVGRSLRLMRDVGVM